MVKMNELNLLSCVLPNFRSITCDSLAIRLITCFMCMMKRRSEDKVNYGASTSTGSEDAIGRTPHHPILRRSQRNSRPKTIQHQSSATGTNVLRTSSDQDGDPSGLGSQQSQTIQQTTSTNITSSLASENLGESSSQSDSYAGETGGAHINPPESYFSTAPRYTIKLGVLDDLEQMKQYQSQMYKNFVDIMTQYKAEDINMPDAMGMMSNLFKGHTKDDYLSNMFQQFKNHSISEPMPDASARSLPGHSMSVLTLTSPAQRSESTVHQIQNNDTPDNNPNGATPPNLRSQQSQRIQYPTSRGMYYLAENIATNGSEPHSSGSGTEGNGVGVASASNGGKYISTAKRELILSDMISFLEEIKNVYPDQPEINYNKFKAIADEFRAELCDDDEFILRVSHFFDWFKIYLPTVDNYEMYSNRDISVICVWMTESTSPHLGQLVYHLPSSLDVEHSTTRYEALPPPQQFSSAAPIVLKFDKTFINHNKRPVPLYLTSWPRKLNRGTE